MQFQGKLPLEIAELIIDNLATDTETLRMCAVTCRALLHRSRTHLFSTVNLNGASHFGDVLHRLLHDCPQIAHLVRHLFVSNVDPGYLADIQGLFSQLESFSCGYSKIEVPWKSLYRDLNFNAMELLRLPSLKYVHFYGFREFPAEGLIPVSRISEVYLSDLQFARITSDDMPPFPTSSSLKFLKLDYLISWNAPPLMQLLALSSLQNLTILPSHDYLQYESQVIAGAKAVVELEWLPDPHFCMCTINLKKYVDKLIFTAADRRSTHSLDIGMISGLRSFTTRILFYLFSPLSDSIAIFQRTSPTNKIEKIVIELEMQNLSQVLSCRAEAWSAIDVALSSGNFEALCQVVFNLAPFTRSLLKDYNGELFALQTDVERLLWNLLPTLRERGILVVDISL